MAAAGDGVPDEVAALLRESVLPSGVPGARGAAWASRLIRTAVEERRTGFRGDRRLLLSRLVAELGGYPGYEPEPGVALRLALRDDRQNLVVLDTLFLDADAGADAEAGGAASGEVMVRCYAKQFLRGGHPERSIADRAIALLARPAPPAAPPATDEPGPVVTIPSVGPVSGAAPQPGWVAADVIFEPGHLRPTDFGAAFTSPTGLLDGEPVTLAVHELSPLVLTGGLVACDPFDLRSAPAALAVAVPAGRFGVFTATATTARGHRFVAAALVRFAADPVARWVLATTPGQDLATLGPEEDFGFGVETGTACFADAGTAAAMLAAAGVVDVEQWRGLPASMADRPEDARRLIDSVYAAFDRFDPALVEAADSWGEVMGAVIAPAGGPGTIVIFGSGGGDGVYATWLGYSASGLLSAVAIDFDVLDSGERLPGDGE